MKTRKQILLLFRAKYDELLSKYPHVGPFEAGRLSSSGGTAIYDFGRGSARLVLGADNHVREVHGGIYDRWLGEGAAYGQLGLPVEDEEDYHGADAHPGDRVSVFENGSIVWRSDTWETEVRVHGVPSQISDADTIHETDIRKSAVDHLHGGLLAFHSYTSYNAKDSRLFLFDFRTGNLSCLSDSWKTVRNAMNAHFSPDGKSLTFMGISNDSGDWDVFVHNIDDNYGEPDNITGMYGGCNEDPKWHPSGGRIVFKHNGTSLVEFDWNGIYGGEFFNILVSGDIELSMPYYTADGAHLLFSPSANGESSIEVANLLTGERNQLYKGGHTYYPVAEDESSFVFVGNFTQDGKHDQLYRGFINGEEAVPLAFNRPDADTSDPFPIGDGLYLVSSTREPRKGIYGLFLADGKTGKAIPLSDIDSRIGTEHQDLGACFWRNQKSTRQVKADGESEAKTRMESNDERAQSVPQIPDYKPGVRVRGVNLGGWLVLERWINESLFAGVQGKDETCFCVQLGRKEATRRLREHWDTWITEDDFAWISAHGFNAVRIPVAHWIFGSASGYPYHDRYEGNPHPYVDGGLERLDRAFDWAEKHGLMILVDLHCAPGCQNAFDNGGLEGVCDWWKKPEYVDFTILTLERLAERYGKRKALWGIETLNEPNWEVPDWVLVDFNWRAYQAIRRYCPPENGAVVIHDGFRDSRINDVFGGKMPHPEFQNVVLDAHRYQCFGPGPGQPDLRMFDHAANVRHAEGHIADEMRRLNETVYWTICGEWSLRTGGDRSDAERQEYFDAQIRAFEQCQGFFFWSYKLENGDPSWSLRDAVERGLKL